LRGISQQLAKVIMVGSTKLVFDHHVAPRANLLGDYIATEIADRRFCPDQFEVANVKYIA